MRLPEEPTPGALEYIPLAGDGWIAPQSAWYGNLAVVGDATGGTASMLVNRDFRFSHVIQFLTPEVVINTAQPYKVSIGRSGLISIHLVGMLKVSTVSGDATSSLTISPPPMINPDHWLFLTDNEDGISHRFKFLVYNFNIQAPLKVPLPQLLGSLPRAGSLI